tara:strand:+ start:416 stop:1366 length:951 start_codon:yes stop_codon:yes gene_type:complete
MSYIGPAPNPGQNREVDDISSGFNGGTAAFTLQVSGQNVSPGSSNAIIVSLGGVVQNPGTDYTIAGSTITFTTNPASGLSFFGLVLGQQIDTEGTADDSIGATQLQTNAVTTAKIQDNAVDMNKLADLDNGRIIARISSGSGNPEAATAAQIRTLLNVADGATAGKLVQVISANKPDQFDTTSTSFVDVASLTATITPTSASNKILVTCHVFANCEDAAVLRLVRHRADTGTVAIGNGQSGSDANNQGFAMVRQDDGNLGSGYGIQILDTSYNTTVQLNYKIQARATSGSAPLGINRRIDNTNYSLSSSITAMEVS